MKRKADEELETVKYDAARFQNGGDGQKNRSFAQRLSHGDGKDASVHALKAKLPSSQTVQAYLARRVHFQLGRQKDDPLQRLLDTCPNVKVLGKQTKATTHGTATAPTTKEGAKEASVHKDYPLEFVLEDLQWHSVLPVGPGYGNLGNTCFLNSVLQVMSHCPPLVGALRRGVHHHCTRQGFCALCSFKRHVGTCFPKGGRASSYLLPKDFAMNIKQISKLFRRGHQEDAHEFFVQMIDRMNDASKQSGFLERIFGNHLASTIKCTECGSQSVTKDPALSLSLEIPTKGKGGHSIQDMLAAFTRAERLQGKNAYACEKCNKKTTAEKRFLITNPPPVLILHFKRFCYSNHGMPMKVNSPIAYAEQLDLKKYLSAKADAGPYHLFGVVVHLGSSSNFGHYIAFVKSANGLWYEMDDQSVRRVSVQHVLSQRAYMLFYTRDPAPASPPRQETAAAHTTADTAVRPPTVVASTRRPVTKQTASSQPAKAKEPFVTKTAQHAEKPSVVASPAQDASAAVRNRLQEAIQQHQMRLHALHPAASPSLDKVAERPKSNLSHARVDVPSPEPPSSRASVAEKDEALEQKALSPSLESTESVQDEGDVPSTFERVAESGIVIKHDESAKSKRMKNLETQAYAQGRLSKAQGDALSFLQAQRAPTGWDDAPLPAPQTMTHYQKNPNALVEGSIMGKRRNKQDAELDKGRKRKTKQKTREMMQKMLERHSKGQNPFQRATEQLVKMKNN